MTGGRLKRVLPYVDGEEFCFTYGDGVADLDLGALLDFHREHGRLATVTAVQPSGRFGALDIEGDRDPPLRGEAEGRRRLDQRRLLRALPRGGALHRRRRHGLGAASRCSAWPQEEQLAAYRHERLLARGRHACATSATSRSCGTVGQAAVEAVGVDPAFWDGRRVLVTGHTGFKGSWLALWLESMGARVTGFWRAARGQSRLAVRAGAGRRRHGDGRAATCATPMPWRAAVRAAQPEVVLHLAAQPIVLRSYRDPAETFAANVMGTVNVLDAVRAARHGARGRGGDERQVLREPRPRPRLPRGRAARRERPVQRAARRARSSSRQRLPALVRRCRVATAAGGQRDRRRRLRRGPARARRDARRHRRRARPGAQPERGAAVAARAVPARAAT